MAESGSLPLGLLLSGEVAKLADSFQDSACDRLRVAFWGGKQTQKKAKFSTALRQVA